MIAERIPKLVTRVENVLVPIDTRGWSNRAKLETIRRSEDVVSQTRIDGAVEFECAEAGVGNGVRREQKTAGFGLAITAFQRRTESQTHVAVEQRLGHTVELRTQMTAANVARPGRQ